MSLTIQTRLTAYEDGKPEKFVIEEDAIIVEGEINLHNEQHQKQRA